MCKINIEFGDEELLPESTREVYNSIVKKSYSLILEYLIKKEQVRVNSVILNLFEKDIKPINQEEIKEGARRFANALAIKNSWKIYNYLHNNFNSNIKNKNVKFTNMDKIFYVNINH